jgi:hypothetical protein
VGAFDWYHQHSSTAARQFLDAVDHAITEITEAPFPYAICYKISDQYGYGGKIAKRNRAENYYGENY